jgi:hypothetical protein
VDHGVVPNPQDKRCVATVSFFYLGIDGALQQGYVGIQTKTPSRCLEAVDTFNR